MATYALYTASLGSQYANDTVKIFDQATNAPAIIMASATGGVVNSFGIATLDGSGNLSVYLDSSKTWFVNPYPTGVVSASSSNTQESTQLLVKTAVQTIATNTSGGGGGSATSALQTTGNTSLASIDGKLPAKGAAASAGSTPVVIASDQAAVPVTVSGVATASNQTTGNTSLGTIATNTPTVGQKTMAGSSPVVIASDQGAVTVTGSVSTTPPADVFVAATNITALNSNPTSGAATANSTVAITLSGQAIVTANISVNSLGAVVTAQVTYDGSNWLSITCYSSPTSSPPAIVVSATIASTVTGFFQWQVAGAKGFRLSANTATVSGTLTASLNASTAASPIMNNVNLTQLGGVATVSAMTQVGGSSGSALGVSLSAPTSSADVSAGAWAAATGTSTAPTDASGAACSFDINLSVYTGGSAVNIDIWMQWSPDNGTTWYDIWQVERLSAAGHAFIPAMLVPGRRRFRWQNNNSSNVATAATTATVTITAMRLSVSPACNVRQWFDRTAGALAGTVSTATAWYDVTGCRAVTAWLPVGVATGPGTYQLQFSADGVTALPAGTAAIAVASTTTSYTSTVGMSARFARLAVTTASTSQTASTSPIVITGC